jgi:MraZ protein
MAGYTGQFECKVDAKGRMKIPSGLLRQVPENTRRNYVLNMGMDKCLVLYSQADWDKLTAKLNTLNYYNEKQRKFQRIFYKMAVMSELDTSDRILIPKRLADAAGINEDAVILAFGNNIEIWSKERYDETVNVPAEDLSSLANEVLGNINLFE